MAKRLGTGQINQFADRFVTAYFKYVTVYWYLSNPEKCTNMMQVAGPE
jgi:hypothetical protein